MSSLEAEEDNAVIIDIEPPKPKRKKIATLKVPIFLLHDYSSDTLQWLC